MLNTTLILLHHQKNPNLEKCLKSLCSQTILASAGKNVTQVIVAGQLENDWRKDFGLVLNQEFASSLDIASVENHHRGEALRLAIAKAANNKIIILATEAWLAKDDCLEQMVAELDSGRLFVGVTEMMNTDKVANERITRLVQLTDRFLQIRRSFQPVSRLMGFDKELADLLPTDRYGEDFVIFLRALEKHGPEAITVLENQKIYWSAPDNWSSLIDVFAFYMLGPDLLYEGNSEYDVLAQKWMPQYNQPSVPEAISLLADELERNNSDQEENKKLMDFFQHILLQIMDHKLYLKGLIGTKLHPGREFRDLGSNQ